MDKSGFTASILPKTTATDIGRGEVKWVFLRLATLIVAMTGTSAAFAAQQTEPSNSAVKAYDDGAYSDAVRLVDAELASCYKTVPSGETCIQLHIVGSEFNLRNGDQQAALSHVRSATDLADAFLPKDDIIRARALSLYGKILAEQSRYGEAELFTRSAISIQQKKLAPNDKELLGAQNVLASILEGLGQMRESEFLFNEILETLNKSPEAVPSNLALATINVGRMAVAQGRYQEGETILRRALELYEQSNPDATGKSAVAYNFLGIALLEQGKLSEAEIMMRRSLALRRQNLPEGHYLIGIDLNDLSAIMLRQGRMKEAEETAKEAIAIIEQTLPSNHRTLAQPVNNLASILIQQRRYAEAGPLFRRALDIASSRLPPIHPDIGRAHNNIAFNFFRQRDYASAESHYRKALAIWQVSLPENHPALISVQSALAYSLGAQSRSPATVRTLFRHAASDLLERIVTFGDFDRVASAELKKHHRIFKGQVRTAWWLSERAENQ